MQYAILIYGSEAAEAELTVEQRTQMSAPYAAYTKALVDAGVLLGGERLKPTATASTVRVRDGRTEVLDGPYPDTKEQLAGFYLINVADLDAALSWAAKCPGAAHGTLEVRPIWMMGE